MHMHIHTHVHRLLVLDAPCPNGPCSEDVGGKKWSRKEDQVMAMERDDKDGGFKEGYAG
jgi:hypothetical protein